MQRVGAALWPSLQAFQVYGANTNVGKTIVSTILCKAFRERERLKVHYLKPVSTGPIENADGRHISRFIEGINANTLFQFSRPVSPHIAARAEGHVPKDSSILQKTYDALAECASQGDGVAIVETAGGVLSPAPSGNSQADLYRPLRLPTLLVGDYHLGGIGTTISAYESLRLRGYDIQLHLMFEEEEYQNVKYLTDYFAGRGIPTIGLPKPPTPVKNAEEDLEAMWSYYQEVTALDPIYKTLDNLRSTHNERIARLNEMPAKAEANFWYPFTQHQGRSSKDVMVIDSAYQDSFDVKSQSPTSTSSVLQPAFDGSASWWTQGLGHGNPDLALAAAYAAGRYGHVMFAGTVHEPALRLTEMLLEYHQNPRLSKVFFSDNGSTGMEVAVKMALRASTQRYSWDHSSHDIEVLGFKGSYHGDTMGVMDCAEPGTYNEKVEWYHPRGYWFDYPTVHMKDGSWIVEVPAGLQDKLGPSQSFATLDDVFDMQARSAPLYREYITDTLTKLRDEGRKFGALIMEPVMLGVAGMVLADPLFQRTLISVIRKNPDLISATAPPPPENPASYLTKTWSGLPVIFDEVFTGIYRLGQFNCNGFLQANPDIVVNAKLLTGGLIPLCTTTASQEIFNAFLSDDKADCLLHGHSYTAHAVGCHVAVESLKTLKVKEDNEEWSRDFAQSWISVNGQKSDGDAVPWSMWSRQFVSGVSYKESVERVVALGSVLGITLKDQTGGGYTSLAAQGLHRNLLEAGEKGWCVHSRVLGNVIYFMTSLSVTPETVRAIEGLILKELA